MILFLILALAGIAYTSIHIWLILPLPVLGKSLLTGLWLLCFIVIFPHFLWGDKIPAWLATATYIIGTSWMIAFVYTLFAFLLLDIGRLIRLVPAQFLRDSLSGTLSVAGAITVLLVYGGFHYHHKYREEIDIKTGKMLERPLTIVLASDIHAGYHNRRAELSRWIGLINAEKPDLVLFAGDILDGAIRPAEEWHYEEVFRDIQAPVFTCVGNHEYLTGLARSESFFREAGIRLLKDESAEACGIRVIGRDDRSNRDRLPLKDLAGADSLFTLLLDHQPCHLEEAEAARIDFQFSGHTHHGQIWPGNWITDAMYEKAFGAHRRGNTRYYVSSGLGIWGGKFRIGTRSEYLVLRLHN